MEELDLKTRRGRNTPEQSQRCGDTAAGAACKAWKGDGKEMFEDVCYPSLHHRVGNTCV